MSDNTSAAQIISFSVHAPLPGFEDYPVFYELRDALVNKTINHGTYATGRWLAGLTETGVAGIRLLGRQAMHNDKFKKDLAWVDNLTLLLLALELGKEEIEIPSNAIPKLRGKLIDLAMLEIMRRDGTLIHTRFSLTGAVEFKLSLEAQASVDNWRADADLVELAAIAIGQKPPRKEFPWLGLTASDDGEVAIQ